MEYRKIFTPFENELLIQLISEKRSIIECKETNKVSSAKKTKAFEEIAKQFNASAYVNARSAQQLRQRYLNLKKKASKCSAEVRKDIRKTGGSDVQQKIHPLEERIISMSVLTQPLRNDSDESRLDNEGTTTTFMSQPVEESNSHPESCVTVTNTQTLDNEKAEPLPFVASSKAAEVMMIEEAKNRMDYEKKANERGEIEHKLRVQLIKRKIEMQEKKRCFKDHLIKESNSQLESCVTEANSQTLGDEEAETLPVTATSKTSEVMMIEEAKKRMDYEKKANERGEIEHKLRVQLLKRKIELQEKELLFKETQIKVQQKILKMLDSEQNFNINLSCS